jgi:hypothetical protein
MDNTILFLLQKLLQDDEKLDNFNIKINTEIKECMLVIINENPELFENIDVSIENIIKDNKINSKDIPDLINLITKFYEVIKNSKNTIKKIDPYTLTEKILDTIFAIYIEVKDIKDTELLNSALDIIKTTINLIRMQSQNNRCKFNFCCL